MRRSFLIFSLVLVVALVAAIAVTLIREARPPAPPTKLKVGIIAPFSGVDAVYGIGVENAAKLALEDLGLSDRVEIVTADTQCDGDATPPQVERLLSEGVVAIVGEICSGATLAAAPIVNERHVPLVSPASTNPDISKAGEYIFRTVPSDTLQGDFIARLVSDRGFKSVAILFSNEAYGKGLSEVFVARFSALGGTVVSQDAFELGDVSFGDTLAAVKAKDPQAIVIVSNSIPSAAAILLKAKELGLGKPIFASEAVKDQSLLDDAGSAAEGLTVTAVGEGTPSFVDRYRQRYEMEPIQFAAQGYDAMAAIGRAVLSGARDGEAIRRFLETISFDGVSGHIAFDVQGDVVGNYDVYVVRDGAFVREGQ
jgi:branched-chain amino acid transport system substrate-binding protein